MPLLQRLSKKVGCRIWDAIKAKLKELTGRDKIDKTLVDYVFVLFDPSNSPQLLRAKLVDFLGDKTDAFVEWFAKVVSQVDNQVSKAVSGEKDGSGKSQPIKEEQSPTEAAEVEKAADACLDGILPQHPKQEEAVDDAPKTDLNSPDHKIVEPEDIPTSRHGRQGRDRSERSHDRNKDHGERKGASRMLSQAAKEAVKSVQSVGSAGSTCHAPDLTSRRERQKPKSAAAAGSREYGLEITVQGDGSGSATKNSSEPEAVEENIYDEMVTPESPDVEYQPVEVVVEEPAAQPITVVTRSSQNKSHKRSFEEAMDVESFHHNPVVVTAAHDVSGATNRFVFASAQGPLVVPEKETQENEPMDEDSNSIPGLLVVMPATTHDPLSRIKLGNADPMFAGGRYAQFDPNMRFNGNPAFNRAPFAHLPPHQSGYWEEPMEEEFNGGNPAKRFRKAPAAIDPSLIMCRFLPRCAKRADVCPYYHPACRNGKFCRFGDSCVYDHSGAPAAANVIAKQLRTKKPICRFHPSCTQPQCQFLHKQAVPCSFGTYCRTGPVKCQFLHPEDVVSESANDQQLLIADYDDDSELCDADGDAAAVDQEQDGSNLSYDELAASVPAQ